MRLIPAQLGVKLVPLLLLGPLVAAALLPSTASAYAQEKYHWPPGQPVVLNLQLGAPNYTLMDGATSWDQVAEAAMSIWNANLGSGVRLQPTFAPVTPAQGDGVNSVLFSRSAFGEDFGADTLAVTIYYGNASTSLFTEADVIFYQNISFNSYRGPLRMYTPLVPYYDLRRVALHEFGHVLGLGHAAQGSASIMAPAITDLDTIQPDDIAGVEAIYGAPIPVAPFISSPLIINTTLGEPFSYQITALNYPDSFAASGLPAGLSLDPITGKMSGVPNETGTYQVVLTAVGGSGAGVATLILTVTAVPSITSPLTVVAYVGKPFRYQIKATSAPTHFSVNPPFSNLSSLPPGLSVNESTGLISGKPKFAGPSTVTLTATNVVASGTASLRLNIANDNTLKVLNHEGASSLARGSDGSVYGTTGGGTYSQGKIFRLNPDDTQTTVFDFSAPGPYNPASVQPAADGSFSGLALRGGANDAGPIYHVGTDGKLTTVYSFASDRDYPFSRSVSVFRGRDGNYYGTFSHGADYAFTQAVSLVYKVTPDGVMTTLHQFDGTDGFYSFALVEGTDRSFYSITSSASYNDSGAVYKLTPDGAFTILHRFGTVAGEGVQPLAPLIQAADGNLYGTTYQGGLAGNGTVFKVTPDGVLTTIHAFTNDEGKIPRARWAQGNDGNLYGTTGLLSAGVGIFAGTLFKVTPDGALTNLHVFAQFDGQTPFLPLAPDGDGNFYGAAKGDSGPVLFKEMPDGVPPPPADPSGAAPTVTLETSTPEITLGGGQPGLFTLSLPAAQSADVVVNLTIKGTAHNGTDYILLKETKTIKAGKTSKFIKITPQGTLGGASKKTVVLMLAPGDGYTVGTTSKVKVKIVSGP